MKINEATKIFIHRHLNDDVRQLALRGDNTGEVDIRFALNQIAGWQAAKKKLPSWASVEGVVYPPHINMEQCSSEETAIYKSNLVSGALLFDLTGGFGVDFSFMSQHFEHAVYVERNEQLCAIAQSNFQTLGLKNVEVVCADGVEYLKTLNGLEDCNHKVKSSKYKFQTVIYLDPSRRDSHGRKVFCIEDCVPDILTLKDELLAKADCVMVKLSPMLDWHAAVRALGRSCREVHIVSVANECKELLLILNNTSKALNSEHEEQIVKIVCVNDKQKFETKVCLSATDNAKFFTGDDGSTEGFYLYVPNASIMKAGVFKQLTDAFPLFMLDKNSHLFVSKESIVDFPGRKFLILATSTMNKRDLKKNLRDIDRANISVRNFPLTAAELRKRLKLTDGGELYLFGTTVRGKHKIIITRK